MELTDIYGARSGGRAGNRHAGPELRGLAMDDSDKRARLLRCPKKTGSEKRVW